MNIYLMWCNSFNSLINSSASQLISGMGLWSAEGFPERLREGSQQDDGKRFCRVLSGTKVRKVPRIRGKTRRHQQKLTFFILLATFCFFLVNLWKRYAWKLRILILLQFELITFRFGEMRTLKIHHFYDFGTCERVLSLSPRSIYFHFWRPQDTSSS